MFYAVAECLSVRLDVMATKPLNISLRVATFIISKRGTKLNCRINVAILFDQHRRWTRIIVHDLDIKQQHEGTL